MVEQPGGALSSGAFKIAAAAIAAVIIGASILVFFLFRQSEAALRAEVLATLRADAAAIEGVAAHANLPALEQVLGVRISADPNRLYLLVSADGTRLAGNLDEVPAALAGKAAGGVFTYRRASESDPGALERQAVALMVPVGEGARVLVGRDIEAEQRMLVHLRLLALGGMALLALAGLAGGYVLSRVVLGRLENVNKVTRTIMAGDLTQRIAVTARGDEIDAVAANVNHMLDRIEQLMNGLREVSDNIAHDLKTPLNRLRNRAEAALRDTRDASACRAGLERTIEDADELIKTFNALLLIARLEAQALEGTTEEVDLGRLVADVVELYEPVAEEAGLKLTYAGGDGILLHVNRHLVGQAVANLVDNAIKYGRASPESQSGSSGGGGGRMATRVDVGVSRIGGVAEISVTDDGPGIGEADRARVLRRFVRLEQSRSRPGTGLGLSLVAAVARLHDGRLRLEDNAPGLRVVLDLPVARKHCA